MCINRRSQLTAPFFLLVTATVLASLSFFFILLPIRSLPAQVGFGYLPLLLGCASLWLCLKARKRAKHKVLVIVYSVMLAPFAFSYPAWLLIVWILYSSGHYNGPMP